MNYYDILKIKKSASEAEIKSAYKSLVKKYHPDLYVGDKEFAEKKIKEINEAYDILSDSNKKAEYDAYLHELGNPAPKVQTSYNAQNAYTQNNQQSQEENTPNPITEFISKKIEKLDTKVQLQIFIAILVIILALFLINIIQLKYYLTRSDSQPSNTTNNSNTQTQNTTIDNSTDFNDNNIFNDNTYTNSQYTFETIDDLFNELMKSYNSEKNEYPDISDSDIFSSTPEF